MSEDNNSCADQPRAPVPAIGALRKLVALADQVVCFQDRWATYSEHPLMCNDRFLGRPHADYYIASRLYEIEELLAAEPQLVEFATSPIEWKARQPSRLELLTQLRRIAVAIEPDEFDMRTWSAHSDCGTTKCLAGHAYRNPWFRTNTALPMIFYEGKYDDTLAQSCSDIWAALGVVFKISSQESKYLFYVDYADDADLQTIAETVAKIDKLIAATPKPWE